MDERIERAQLLCDRATFGGETEALPVAGRELDAVEADLSLARGRVLHARHLQEGTADTDELVFFERAARLYHALGDQPGEAEAEFWTGVYHQVVQGDHDSALPALHRSRELATAAGENRTLSYALRHLGIAAHMAGELADARALLEESTRLRRDLGFAAGVAANLVGLAYLTAAEGRPGDALALLDEAAALAAGADARAVLRSVDEARAALG
ncbi:tetratricopeptide repeat protein [Kitasatospora sp. RG8]|uniref:tetratricopeptide repeat protein n=1 Tax=Kitasatospora sp. RG8 TaxID=2820815 RepID=UPI001AE07078|nr:tetratricopeptide repeat protein [Kitasatospora sp. RG8]MBP0452736.1 tetratricopeptide repeat protein [Kitasatospora sp. RG8]